MATIHAVNVGSFLKRALELLFSLKILHLYGALRDRQCTDPSLKFRIGHRLRVINLAMGFALCLIGVDKVMAAAVHAVNMSSFLNGALNFLFLVLYSI